MPKLSLECDMCEYKTTKYVGGWRKHLMEEEHQIRARERSKKFKDADKERCSVVFGVCGLSHEKLLKFFSEQAVVTDFIFWKERPDICIVEFYLKKACATITAGTKSILGSEVVIRLRNEISDIEWRTICPLFSLMKSEADEMNNQAPETPDSLESDDDDCIVIENPQVEVKKEMIVVDVDLKAQSMSNPATSSNASHRASLNSTVSERNADATQDKKPIAKLVRSSCDKQTYVTPTASEHPSPPAAESPSPSLANVKKEPNEEDGSTKKTLNTSNQLSNRCPDTVLSPPRKKPRIEPDESLRTINAPADECNPQNHRRIQVAEAEPDLMNNESRFTSQSTQKTKKPRKIPNYSVKSSPSPQFLHAIRRSRNTIRIQRILESNISKHTFWIERVQEFNLLVWENLFGIELFANTCEDATRATGVKVTNGMVQDGPLIRGILITTDKIKAWTQLSTDKKILKHSQLAFLESLKHGLRPKPLKDFDETAHSLSKRSNALLTFELQIFRSAETAKLACVLSFKNIVSSYFVDLKHFKMITQMYTGLWDEFCMWKFTKPNY